jgi:transposase
MLLKYSVGLDVSSKKIDACISTINEVQKVTVKSTKVISNTLKGFKDLNFWIKKHQKDKDVPLFICMEATGVYHELCALYLYEEKFTVSIILPNKANKYLQAIGLKSKNDTIDAKGLAQMGAEQNLKVWQPMGRYFYELRTYTRQYQSLQENKTAINNQIHALELTMYQSKKVLRQLRKVIKLFDEQLKELTKLIAKHIANNIDVSQKVENICKVKGLATLTVATILAETNGFELFENYKQLVSFSGYDVVEKQSGTRQGKTKISKQGNSRIRRALFMPAFSVVTWKQKPFIDLYNRTFEKHGIKMKSYVAVQKKLLIIIYALWKSGEDFDKNHQTNSPAITSETTQDSHYKNNFSDESQMYEYLTKDETTKNQAKKVYSHS